MAGETNRLLDLARVIDPKADAREIDVLVSTGEQVTIALLTMALHNRQIEARSYTGGQVRILTDNVHGKARILDIDAESVRADIAQRNVVVIAGFQGVDESGNITTLGRGGSDTTAVAMAAALHADECRIYTDVDGVYTADPAIFPRSTPPGSHHSRGNAGTLKSWRQGFADPVGRICWKIQGSSAGFVVI
ncbi:MAG: hypothetical protein Ct9H300mP16_17750 [Pseudomonadota bacterium]|nr:MAG: hypothetical protein Ct9H300mP16_17750 [Pseudomonadota bacterium]